MDLKLIVSTFFIIFLAELGDKTQFAAMAASAGSNKPVSILIGAVLALAVSSVIAVAAGALIGNLIPVKYIKIAAGVLFLVFGALYIREAFTIETPPEEKPESGTLLETPVIKAAKAFEIEELNMLNTAREKITEPECRDIIDEMIKQEEGHLDILHNIHDDESCISADDFTNHQVLTDAFACSEEDDETLAEVCRREEAMADFYRLMSEKTMIASVRSTFRRLHDEEQEHTERIKLLLKKG